MNHPGLGAAPAWCKGLIGELWAESFGCLSLISFGDGVVAMVWAPAAAFAVYVCGGISGAHIKPADTLGAALVYLVYHRAIANYDHAHHIVKGTTASVAPHSTFATNPARNFGPRMSR